MQKPTEKPNNPNFSSGPCAKRPGWALENLDLSGLGRSHRSAMGKQKLEHIIEKHRELLGIPSDYRIAIVPASDTGAFEMAMWAMLGAKPVDVFAWESFSGQWLTDITDHLKLDNVNAYQVPYGEIADLTKANPENDIVFAWNGTTSGVRVPDGDWVAADREGLTFCDATSAVFAYDFPWDKLDVTTWSWQKVLGGEAAHGMLVLSPRAVERLLTFTPENRPLPKIFRMTKGSGENTKLIEGLFKGETLNTPSMLAVADCEDALNWIEAIGGLKGAIARVNKNAAVVDAWLEKTEWASFLSKDDNVRSKTSICIKISDSDVVNMSEDDQVTFLKDLCALLEEEGAAYDVKGHRDAPPHIRLWGGATIDSEDLQKVMPWLDWAFAETKAKLASKAA